MARSFSPSTRSSKGKFRQYLAALTVTLGMIIVGESFAWPSPTLPLLQDPSNPLSFHLDHTQTSWVVSLLYVGNLLSPIPTSYIMDKYGRQHSLMVLGILPIVSWTLIYMAKSAVYLYFARFLAGLWVGIAATVSSIYIGEIAEPEVRGALGNLVCLMSYSGNFFMFLVGPFVSYFTLALICGVLPLIFMIAISFIPESPHYFLMHNNKEGAIKSLKWLRGNVDDKDLTKEIDSLTANISLQRKGNLKDIFMGRANRKAFLIVVALAIFLKFSGANVLVAYASTTLPDGVFGFIGPSECVIFLGATWVVSAIFSILLVDRLGRKVLLIFSSLGCSLAMFFAGGWFYMHSKGFEFTNNENWIPFISFVCHGVLYSLGLGPIGMAIKGEILATNIRGTTSAITTIVLALSSVVLNKFYLLVADSFGMHVNYWAYAVSCFLAALFSAKFVVETKGKSLQEIQELLEK